NPINLLLQHGNKGQGTLTVDPGFVNFKIDGSGDYHLRAGSPAIGAGTSVGEPATDMNGLPRTIGAAVDLGPYAYTSIGSTSGSKGKRHVVKKLH
ncbi:MAG: choice-of-anchor Q domain-containing protein, partial [Ktedonobacteraceae bacterium]